MIVVIVFLLVSYTIRNPQLWLKPQLLPKWNPNSSSGAVLIFTKNHARGYEGISRATPEGQRCWTDVDKAGMFFQISDDEMLTYVSVGIDGVKRNLTKSRRVWRPSSDKPSNILTVFRYEMFRRSLSGHWMVVFLCQNSAPIYVWPIRFVTGWEPRPDATLNINVAIFGDFEKWLHRAWELRFKLVAMRFYGSRKLTGGFTTW
jgi:hypothetical protein